MSQRLGDDAVRAALERLPAWSVQDGKLHRELRFPGFPDALAFLVRIGVEAEKRGHHPELSNVYDRVTIDLVTHDVGGISEKDLDLARLVDEVAPA
jgi:4a-hydroxytetrahydrobiopterin dehydratase